MMNDSIKTVCLGGVSLPLRLRYEESAAWLRRFAAPRVEGAPVAVSDEDFAAWRGADSAIDAYAEFCLLCMPASEALFAHERCVFHAAALRFRDRAWLIAGGSGVGKSTHCRELLSLAPGELTVINGDKPVLECREDGSVLVHPSPWNGKEGWQGGEAAPLAGLVCLRRGEASRMEACCAREAAPMVFSNVFQSYSDERVIRAAGRMAEKILRAAPVWRLTSRDVRDSAGLLLEFLQREAEK